ncbi:hypothetical protein AB0A69_24065 [Streptomyces sp. NPDC045431]|uniref:hypothetical protein n=1 Tax=Streptomyces sp. NPDC045431 TaxID=3155613 RepID=UPI00340CD214
MAETTGDGERELPAFTPEDGAYTVYAACAGKGKVSIGNRDGAGNSHPVACDGVRTGGVVHVEKEVQRLVIRVAGGTSEWKVAVIAGSHQP